MTVAYDGSSYYGFQRQPNTLTIESKLTEAIELFFGTKVNLSYAGRTDSQVHASNQIVVVTVNVKRDVSLVVLGVNRYLPNSINILDASLCDSVFHPRFDAKYRVYSYAFTSENVPFYLKNFLVPVQFYPKQSCFKKFSDIISGTHDFKRIIKKNSNNLTTVRTIIKCDMYQDKIKDLYDFEKVIPVYQIKITADAFLYRMVRNLISLYFSLEKNKITTETIFQLINGKCDRINIKPVPAYGLTLLNVVY